MGKKLQIVIDKNGKIVESFSGFTGGDCYKEAAMLREKLKELGIELELEPGSITPTATPIPEEEAPVRQKELEGN